jgi:hypothetical protein
MSDDSMTLPSPAEPSFPATEPAVRNRRPLWTSLFIGLLCFVVYNANLRAIAAGDTYPARYLPFAILQHHTLFMNPIEDVAAQGRGDGAYWMLHRPDGRIMSLYPVVVPMAVAPLYLPAMAFLHGSGSSVARLDYVAKLMEKLSASFLAALSASLLYLLLRRRTTPRTALVLTIAYAFGTTTWVTSSQALWQHGLAEVLVIAVLLLLTAPCTTPRAVSAAMLCGLIACNRPPDIVLGAALGFYALVWAGRSRWVLLAAAAAAPMLLVLVYNVRFAGNIGGGYGVIGKAAFFDHNPLIGTAGLLISPGKGLFVFSPFLLFLVLAWRGPSRGPEERRLTLFMSVAVVLQIVLYAKVDWRGGLSWGPRYMTDLLPFLMWMLVPAVEELRGVGLWAFRIAVGVAIVMEAIGAFCYVGWVDNPIYAVSGGPHEMDAVWQWRNAAFLSSLRKGLSPPELSREPRGTFDAVEVAGHTAAVVTAGEPAFAAGWALAGHSAPWQVGVAIDGHNTVATTTFTERPDVRDALHEASPSGWRVPLDTSRLTPGKHQLTALLWVTGSAEAYCLDERTLTVRGGAPAVAGVATPSAGNDLQDGFATAAARIRQHQQAPGYWLTSYTSAARFRDPHPEMNTFLTSLLVDLLDPVAAGSGLGESLQQARRHLTSQIEANGLVRYHGLPNAPGIGTLGCAITPDTDDTALVWRIAPAPDRARLATALATIDRYRTPAGLYRSWLAPREDYQCLDPGSDPNPADIAIQMHLLLLLAEARPQAGHALCEALRPQLDQDRIWVYYAGTPLVPILRLTDLHHAGCDLQLPEARLRTIAPDQGVWLSVARWLTPSMTPKGSPPDPILVRALLREIARDDFAYLRSNPPLLYHNDLTATVARYYWSEDVGYALWLRLYNEYELHGQRSGGA